MDIRPYAPSDRNACLSLFDSNSPAYWSPSVRKDFEDYLDAAASPYFVMEHEAVIVGSGGYLLEADSSLATLQWGMIRADLHRNGLGRFLLLYRLREIGKAGSVSRVRLETPAASVPFYRSQGFQPLTEGPVVQMIRKIAVCP